MGGGEIFFLTHQPPPTWNTQSGPDADQQDQVKEIFYTRNGLLTVFQGLQERRGFLLMKNKWMKMGAGGSWEANQSCCHPEPIFWGGGVCFTIFCEAIKDYNVYLPFQYK